MVRRLFGRFFGLSLAITWLALEAVGIRDQQAPESHAIDAPWWRYE